MTPNHNNENTTPGAASGTQKMLDAATDIAKTLGAAGVTIHGGVMNNAASTDADADAQALATGGAIDASTDAETSAAGSNLLSAALAASDIEHSELNPYQKWQQKWDGTLFDGTMSQASYIRIGYGAGIEYGIQPRLMPHPSGLIIGGLVRVSHIVNQRTSASEPAHHNEKLSADEADAKVDALKAFIADGNNVQWSKVTVRHIRRTFQMKLPILPQKEDTLEQLVALCEAGLFGKVIETLPKPAEGWDMEQLELAKNAFVDYLKVTGNQFGLFNVVTVTEKKWDDAVPAVELKPELVEFLGKAPDASDEDTE